MIRKYAVQITGIILMAFGLFYIYFRGYVYYAVRQPSQFGANAFLDVFFTLFFSVLAIYGGIELWRLQEVGRKLALIWFSWILFSVVLAQLNNYRSEASTPLQIFQLKYLIPLLIGYLFYAVSLIFLSSSKVMELMSYDEVRMQRVGRILAFGAPGLGRALSGNFLVGMLLFAFYVFILEMMITEPYLAKTVFSIVAWKILSAIDSAEVKKIFEEEETEMIITEGNTEIERG